MFTPIPLRVKTFTPIKPSDVFNKAEIPDVILESINECIQSASFDAAYSSDNSTRSVRVSWNDVVQNAGFTPKTFAWDTRFKPLINEAFGTHQEKAKSKYGWKPILFIESSHDVKMTFFAHSDTKEVELDKWNVNGGASEKHTGLFDLYVEAGLSAAKVYGDIIVEYVRRDGSVYTDYAGRLSWKHTNEASDVMEWRFKE